MTISQCLDAAVAGGELAPDEAAALRRDFERFRANRENGGSSMADEQAKADLIEALTAEAAHKRRKAKLALKNIQEIDNDLRNWKNAKGEYDIAAAALDKLEHFGTRNSPPSPAGKRPSPAWRMRRWKRRCTISGAPRSAATRRAGTRPSSTIS